MPLNAGEPGVPANGSAWASSVLLLHVAACGKGVLFLVPVPVAIFEVALSVLNWEVSRLRCQQRLGARNSRFHDDEGSARSVGGSVTRRLL